MDLQNIEVTEVNEISSVFDVTQSPRDRERVEHYRQALSVTSHNLLRTGIGLNTIDKLCQ